MEKIPKMSGVFRGNCCQICRNITQKTPDKNSLTDRCFSGKSAANSDNQKKHLTKLQ